MDYLKLSNIVAEEIEDGILLKNVSDFNAKHIFECGQCFRWDKEEDDSYTVIAFGKVINVKSNGNEVRILNTDFKDFKEIWFEYLDLGRDYSRIKEVLSTDDTMKSAIKYGEGIRILKQDPWETLISFIISANNRIPMIARSISLFSQMYGQTINYNDKVYYTFPTIKDLSEADLSDIKSCKAGFRCKYIIKAIEMVRKGEINLEKIKSMKTIEAEKELKKIPGVGIKVANCILLFSMQKYDTYPVDVWMKRITEELFLKRKSKTGEISDFAQKRFGDFSGFAQEYLFYYARELKIGKS